MLDFPGPEGRCERHLGAGDTYVRVGILDILSLPSRHVASTVSHFVMTKQFASLTPQAVAVWCRRAGHETFYAPYYGVGNPQRRLPSDLDIVFICSYTQASPHLRFYQDHHLLVEPACGASLAALYEEADFLSGKQNILAIVCGGAGVTISQLEQWERTGSPPTTETKRTPLPLGEPLI